jgi:hypothetical protein
MGICQADPKVATWANMAIERLLIDPMAPEEGWWGGKIDLHLTASIADRSAYVTVPREIGRLVGVAVCNQPVPIRNGFYEYLQFGAGLKPSTCQGGSCDSLLQAFERDNIVTLAPMLPTPQQIRVYPTDTRDTGRRVLIQGKDQNKKVVLSTDAVTGGPSAGEYLQLAFPFSTSLNTFSPPLFGLQKDETYGPLEFFQVDPVTGVETPLTTMDPGEGVASYRRYLINGIPTHNLCCASPAKPLQLKAQGRLDFIPVINETDYLTIPCVPALLEEAQSLRYSRMDSATAAQQAIVHHAAALRLLNGQLDAYAGKTSVAVRVSLFGSAPLRPQPV